MENIIDVDDLNVDELREQLRRLINENRNRERKYLHLVHPSAVPPESAEAIKMYQDMAERIRFDTVGLTYIEALYGGLQTAKQSGVFTALCVPSGTGKTQLAFTLPQDRCSCIYLNLSIDSDDLWSRQSVYKAFGGYMLHFLKWLEQDSEKTLPSSLNIYGFLYALINLLMRHPELDLPADLSRLRISDKPPDSDFEVVEPENLENVQASIRKWSEKFGNKQLVIFVDEFAWSHKLTQSQLAFLRRRLMKTGACVIVASTDSGALNMLNTTAATRTTRERVSGPWAQVITQLPKYVPPLTLREAVNALDDSAIKQVLNLCIDSRPLFASSVEKMIQIFVASSPTREKLVDFIELLRDQLEKVLRTKRLASTQMGCFGYTVAMLIAGWVLVSGDQSQMKLFANFTTKNWAYLVHDPAILRRPPVNTDQSEGDTVMKDRSATISISNSNEPALLMLWRESGDQNETDSLTFQVPGGESHPFPCMTFFPSPMDDFLFYLVLAGSTKRPGLQIHGHNSSRTRISVAKLFYSVVPNGINLQSRNSISPNWGYHEAVVCAAFFTACNAGSVSGCSLEELVTRFLAELITPRSISYPTLIPVDKIPFIGEFRSRFIFPFDTVLPGAVHEVLGTRESSRPPSSHSVDAVTCQPLQSNQYEILVEAKTTTDPEYVKDRIKIALQRQDSNAKISFIVVDKDPEMETRFDPNDFRVLNKFARGETLNARVFRIDIDASNKVVLCPIDGEPENAEAERVIFVICLENINHKFMRSIV